MYSVVFSARLYVIGLQMQVLNEMARDDNIRISEESFPRVTTNLIVQRYFTLLHMHTIVNYFYAQLKLCSVILFTFIT